ncbi:MAG TPA: CheB methylesterase domain-containing protein [Candidatus Polarisedimenticolia bacterium]|nr:CheB methylesterase domain-containing protein [Candidatus Polarisedimenticolia bacterium]
MKAARSGLIAVGCSAGGPPALEIVLPALPRATELSIVVAQHMPEKFTTLFAARLARLCSLPVAEPRDGEPLSEGRIYIAPGNRQTTLERTSGGVIFRVRPRDASERYAPSADLLLESVAEIFGPRAVGVLLSGMGGDGAAGMRAIKERRGCTLAESEKTARVFGMPAEAIRAGLADQVLPLPEIARELARLCGRDLYSSR